VQPADARDRRIEQLEAALAERDALIDKLMARVEALEAKVASLSRDSTNSSKPPSADPPGTTRPASKSTGKKRGGQPGHQGHQRQLLPPEQVNRTVDVLPDVCDGCGARLHGRDHDPLRHQVVDIPPLKPDVTEFRLHALDCACGAVTRAQLPAGVPHGAFGPRLSAMLSVCTAKYRLSKRAVRELLADFLGVDLSLGSVSNVEEQVSDALDAPVAEAAQHVQRSTEVNADETSWREDKKKGWRDGYLLAAGAGDLRLRLKRGECVHGHLLGCRCHATSRRSGHDGVGRSFTSDQEVRNGTQPDGAGLPDGGPRRVRSIYAPLPPPSISPPPRSALFAPSRYSQ
jgi:transposase